MLEVSANPRNAEADGTEATEDIHQGGDDMHDNHAHWASRFEGALNPRGNVDECDDDADDAYAETNTE